MARLLPFILAAIVIAGGAIAWRLLLAEPTSPPPTRAELLASLTPLIVHAADGDVTLRVEVADSAPERAEGLQERTVLAKNSGMLFVFDAEGSYDFWMKNVRLPLDVLWISRDKTIIGHDTMAPCLPDNPDTPCPVTSSPAGTLYALEVHDQFVEERGVHAGTRVSF